MKAVYKKYILDFKRPSGTSRGVMTKKETWFIVIIDGDKKGIGECGILRGLSIDDRTDYENKLQWTCDNINLPLDVLLNELIAFPSIQFGVEQALLSVRAENPFELFPSDFTEKEASISINGLVWMGDEPFMHEQIEQKIKQGFSCIKMKVGAINFEKEIALLTSIRKRFSRDKIELRVDANGAFVPEDAIEKLSRLAALDLHSIEQPIKPKQWQTMAELCSSSPLPIALDEELIGVFNVTKKQKMLQTIRPQYIILKPSLIGGFKGTQEWIDLASDYNIGWWVTSALESNIGLNAIAQWTYTLNTKMYQGLGTGSLFTNNFESPLQVTDGQLIYRKKLSWQSQIIEGICT